MITSSFFFFKQKTAYDIRISDWSSDVCSSDLIQPHHGRSVAAALGLSGDLAKQAAKVLGGLYAAFLGTDAEQIEINPLAVCEGKDGDELLVLDAKVAFDGNEIGRAHV